MDRNFFPLNISAPPRKYGPQKIVPVTIKGIIEVIRPSKVLRKKSSFLNGRAIKRGGGRVRPGHKGKKKFSNVPAAIKLEWGGGRP